MKITKHFIFNLLLLILFTCLSVGAEEKPGFFSVTGPCGLQFPRDHGPHPGYRTEWWYYTGNLKAASGNRYGFQLTFFRSQISPPGTQKTWPKPPSAWRTQQIYLGHAAISDMSGNQHLQAELVSRAVLGLAGARREANLTTVFLKNWSTQIEPNRHRLTVAADNFSYELELKPAKDPVLHGKAGYSRKGSTPERASCYYSFTRLRGSGKLIIRGKPVSVDGLGWMDHEFSSAPLEPGILGWDWFSLQLSDHTEVMIYFLRKSNGELSPASSGTFVDADGNTRYLVQHEIRVKVLDTWESPNSGAVYPARWRLILIPLSMDLTVISNMADQEMQTPQSTNITYWEGNVSVMGTTRGRPINGQGYAELTGYAKPLDAPM